MGPEEFGSACGWWAERAEWPGGLMRRAGCLGWAVPRRLDAMGRWVGKRGSAWEVGARGSAAVLL